MGGGAAAFEHEMEDPPHDQTGFRNMDVAALLAPSGLSQTRPQLLRAKVLREPLTKSGGADPLGISRMGMCNGMCHPKLKSDFKRDRKSFIDINSRNIIHGIALKGTRHLFLMNSLNMRPDQEASFKELKNASLHTARAWGIKELFISLWSYNYEKSARSFFKKWFGWASRCQLRPIVKVAKMIKRHFENIVTYIKHPITNAFSEGINSKIQTIKANARGFRNFSNYRTRILFYCGKLNLHPI
jgi:transposase